MTNDNLTIRIKEQPISRRHFLAGTGAAALAFSAWPASLARGAEAGHKINLGLIGCGGRGQWIANLFLKHGGYNLTAVADYFPEKADSAGQKFNVPAAKRFTGLSCYKRLLETEVEAVAVESPPYFHPEQAAAAVAAGKHVYLAKPIAVDVPGCQTIGQSGKKASANKLCFLLDFQTRTHPAYQEVVKRVHAGGIGRLVNGEAAYKSGLTFQAMDAEYRKNPQHPEARLKAWGVDRVLSGDIIIEQNIHALDVATWFLNADPVQAYGTGGRVRPYLGNCWDNFAVIFYFPDNVTVSFCSSQVGFGYDDIMCRLYGTEGSVDTHYGAKIMLHSREEIYNGNANNLGMEGTIRNVATFYDNIARGDFSNPTVAPGVRSNLTCILGRTAAYKKTTVTWKAMMRANEKLEVSFKGCKA
jgi:myo-inositol 2-dehydrogenase/D-chiro-inositol 1-dehydrogenase